jgi:hypothetical protein
MQQLGLGSDLEIPNQVAFPVDLLDSAAAAADYPTGAARYFVHAHEVAVGQEVGCVSREGGARPGVDDVATLIDQMRVV